MTLDTYPFPQSYHQNLSHHPIFNLTHQSNTQQSNYQQLFSKFQTASPNQPRNYSTSDPPNSKSPQILIRSFPPPITPSSQQFQGLKSSTQHRQLVISKLILAMKASQIIWFRGLRNSIANFFIDEFRVTYCQTIAT